VIDPVNALQGAVSVLDLPVSANGASAEKHDSAEAYTLKGTSGTVKAPEAHLVYFQTEDGKLELAWKVETDIYSNWLQSYVSASDNKNVLAVVDWSADATYQV